MAEMPLTAQLPWASRSLGDRMALHEALLKVLSEGGVGVVLADAAAQRLLYANEAAAQLGGYREDELLALPSFFDLVAPEERERLTARLQSNLESTRPSDRGETTALHKDGHRVPVEYHAEIVEVNGAVLVVTLIRDLTGSRLAEQVRVDLTRQAGEIDALRRLDRQRARLLRKVANDLRAPLTPATLELHVLREKLAALGEEDQQRLAVLERSLATVQRRLEAYLRPLASSEEWTAGVDEWERQAGA